MPADDEETDLKKHGRVLDKIEEELLKARRIFMSAAVDGDSAQEIIRKLWYLELTKPGKPITFVINSPGGSVDAGFAIYDQIKMLSSPIKTLVTGLSASMGTILGLAATKKNRHATQNSRFMIHQPSIHGLVRGPTTALKIQSEEIDKTRKALIAIYMKETGKDFKTIEKALDWDTWMSAEEALEFGLIDSIVSSYKDL